ncbi:MAG: inositol-phosphate phosphatase [Oscillochloris sp.]|nr:inositol-phosphate phosphatase [Oscillochloris sp.]
MYLGSSLLSVSYILYSILACRSGERSEADVSEIDLAVVQAWAREGGTLARTYFNRVAGTHKPDNSLVTEADVAVEQLLRARISEQYPDHGIIGEEGGFGAVDREFVWAIDPIDGTGGFVSGLPIWCVSIGLMRRGEAYLGVIYLPILDDCYAADATGPAYRNDEVIMVRPPNPPGVNDWIAVPSSAHRDYRIKYPGKVRGLGSIAAECCYVARGTALGALIGRPKLWDLAAGIAIMRAAGAVVVGMSGAPLATQALLQGAKVPEPLLIAHPEMIPVLQGWIERR